MTCITRERTEDGWIIRRYVNDRLEAERGPGYSLGTPKITESEYFDPCQLLQQTFLEAASGVRK